jgi:predicted nucleic acid-binding protein
MIIVSDTTPLSELAKIGQLNLLKDVFRTLIIPQEVYQEITTGNHPAATIVPSIDWIKIHSISNLQTVSALQTSTGLDLGECAAIVLAEELKASQILIDDRAARIVAESKNLAVIGTIGTLLLAKDRGLIPHIKPILDQLIASGKWISINLYQQALNEAKE